jgi:HlyD family secretion protein
MSNSNIDTSIRKHASFGMLCAIALIVGVGGWSVVTNLSGAVMGMGVIAVEGNNKKIQHPTGGVIKEIFVREGSIVQAGEVLMTLDETNFKANAQIVQTQADEAMVRIARLEAEERQSLSPKFPQEIMMRGHDSELKKIIAAEMSLLSSRLNSIASQKVQLAQRIDQANSDIKSLTAQNKARGEEVTLMQTELTNVEELTRKGYAANLRLIGLKRDFSRLKSERDNLVSELEKAQSRKIEAESMLERVDIDAKKEVATELRDVKTRLNELYERGYAAKDALGRSQIRSPYAGVVHQLNAVSVGGVVGPGEPIMLIVPHGENLIVEAKIMQNDIDQVRLEQKALLRFTAFNARTTPEIYGMVVQISPDLVQPKDMQSSQLPPHYIVRVALDEGELKKIKGQKIQVGMNVDTLIHTESRNALSYLTKPIADQMARSFIER